MSLEVPFSLGVYKMPSYRVPQNLNEEEKLIGGVASLRQTAYGVIGLLIGIFFAYLVPGNMTVKIAAFSVPLVLSIFFGFARYMDLSLDHLLYLYVRYWRSKKYYRYERKKRIWQ